ncbi:12742_t:CDS:2 [Acaulospora morrowiae]|uniref:12742_t:CDS:1 n=1 Tax=Acaulospora morrowiae TaxID=94023 RepID=A0A9N9F8P0_9GLOM|nr:12742_t:CDS:2 [Acaulospora morrowiae]
MISGGGDYGGVLCINNGGGMLWLMVNVAVASSMMETATSFIVASIRTVVQCCTVIYNTVASCTAASCFATCYAAVYHVVAFNLTCYTMASHVAASSHHVVRYYERQLRAVATSRQCGGDYISWQHPALQVATSFCGGISSILLQSYIAAASSAYSGNFVLRRCPGSVAATSGTCAGIPAILQWPLVPAVSRVSCNILVMSWNSHTMVMSGVYYGVPVLLGILMVQQ